MPVVRFTDHGAYKLDKGDVLRVSAIYDNPLGKSIPDGAMGIVVGYFLPNSDAELAGLYLSSVSFTSMRPFDSTVMVLRMVL